MKILILATAILLSYTQANAAFGFDCKTEDNKVQITLVDYETMLGMVSLTIDEISFNPKELTTNLFLGSVLGVRVMDKDLLSSFLVAELKPTGKEKIEGDLLTVYQGQANYTDSSGKLSSTIIKCLPVQ